MLKLNRLNHTAGRSIRPPAALGAAVLWVFACATAAEGNINIELRPAASAVAPNAFVNIGLFLVSDSAVTQYSIAADVVFSWDNTRLQFLGINNTGGAPVTLSDLPANSTLNETLPPADGDGFYQMLGQFGNPVAATPAGTLLTTFRFKALSTACTGAAFTILPSGGNPVRVTKVLDGIIPNNNITGTLGSALVFIDGTPPVINTCAPAQVVPAGPTCTGVMPDMTGLVSVADNCSNLTITQAPLAGATLSMGPHAVVIQVKDPGGNIVSCPTSVTVVDQTSPVISQCSPPPPTIPADATCQAAIPDLTSGVIATDACSPPVTVTQSPLPGTLVGLGPHTVTLTAKDSLNNASICQVDVTVADQTGPQISQCAAPQTMAANANCEAAIPDLTGGVIATDACSPPVTVTQSPTAGSFVGLGPHSVTLTATDAANNISTCLAVVTVADQTAPAISQCASAQTIAADANRQAQIPDLTGLVIASDLCSPPVVVTQSPLAGTVVGLGPHTVTFTASDAANNSSNCQAVVTVADQTDPVIDQCAPSPTVAADANCQAAIPDLTGSVIATDACSPPVVVTQSPTAGTLVGLGPHTVTLTATDAASNASTCDAVVTVEDQTAPDISQCAASQTIPADANCQAAIPDLTGQVIATDACSPPVSVTQSPTAGTLAGPGPHTVTLTAKDAANNESTCQAAITVADQTPPSLMGCPTNMTVNTNVGSCSAVVSWSEPTASDNCGGATVVRTQGPAPGSTFAGGSTTTIEYTATDGANLTSVCSFTVTVTPSPDMDNDGDVDTADLPVFVNVLLGVDTTPLRVARADVNCDGAVNGRDIQPFTDILTP